MKSKNVNYKGCGLSPVSKASELNMLSYLVRKYPQEAMNHLCAKEMQKEIDARIVALAVKRGIIEVC